MLRSRPPALPLAAGDHRPPSRELPWITPACARTGGARDPTRCPEGAPSWTATALLAAWLSWRGILRWGPAMARQILPKLLPRKARAPTRRGGRRVPRRGSPRWPIPENHQCDVGGAPGVVRLGGTTRWPNLASFFALPARDSGGFVSLLGVVHSGTTGQEPPTAKIGSARPRGDRAAVVDSRPGAAGGLTLLLVGVRKRARGLFSTSGKGHQREQTYSNDFHGAPPLKPHRQATSVPLAHGCVRPRARSSTRFVVGVSAARVTALGRARQSPSGAVYPPPASVNVRIETRPWRYGRRSQLALHH